MKIAKAKLHKEEEISSPPKKTPRNDLASLEKRLNEQCKKNKLTSDEIPQKFEEAKIAWDNMSEEDKKGRGLVAYRTSTMLATLKTMKSLAEKVKTKKVCCASPPFAPQNSHGNLYAGFCSERQGGGSGSLCVYANSDYCSSDRQTVGHTN